MIRQARSRILYVVFTLGISLNVCAQMPHPEVPHAKFAVDTSGPGLYHGVGIRDNDVTFRADVSDAARYQLSFGDNTAIECNLERNLVCDTVDRVRCEMGHGSDHVVVCVHRYEQLADYKAELNAVRKSGESIIPLTIPVAVKPPPPAPEPELSVARFSAVRSNPRIHSDIEHPEADFTFTAYVDDAESYELQFGDDNRLENIDPDLIEPRSATKGIRHVYSAPGSYTARMKAWRNTGDWVENELVVDVKSPPPLELVQAAPIDDKPGLPVQQPVMVATLTPTPKPIWPWLLVIAAAAVLMGTFVVPTPTPTGSADIRFEPTADLGHVRVVGSAHADSSVAMRIRRDPGRLAVRMNEGEA